MSVTLVTGRTDASTAGSQTERAFHIDELFFSTTDLQGRIRSGNDVFARVSGYTLPELLGKPHSIVRHPDMPRAVFKLLWEYLQAGRSIAAYVKNRAKDGLPYWVVALVLPAEDGYLSVRFKPSSAYFPVVRDLYQQLLTSERCHVASGRTSREGMEAAYQELLDTLPRLGFATYDAFMHAVLREEMKSRDALMRAQGGKVHSGRLADKGSYLDDLLEQCTVAGDVLDRLFAGLEGFVTLNRQLEANSEFISNLARTIHRLALNASVEATRMGGAGATMAVLSNFLGENSAAIGRTVKLMNERLTTLIGELKEVVYDLSSSRLMLEMLTFFADELRRQQAGTSGRGGCEPESRKSAILRRSLEKTSSQLLQRLIETRDGLAAVNALSDDLNASVLTLQFIQLNGRVEATRLQQPTRLISILEEVLNNVDSAKERLGRLRNDIASVQAGLGDLEQSRDQLFSSLQRMAG